MASKKTNQGQHSVMTGSQIPHAGEPRHTLGHYWVWIALLAVILFTAAIRLRLLAVPLERDEGEYAYAGQLILQGVPPYAQVYNMKMPGIYAAYALILAVFGQTHTGIHLGLLVINTATILLLFLLAKRLLNPFVAVAAAGAFALLSLGQSVQGLFANAEHFVILPAIAAILLLLHALDRQRWFSLLAGALLLGLAFIMKQHGAAFIIFAGLYLFYHELRHRPFAWKLFVSKAFLFMIGVSLPFAITCLLLWRAGVFEKFWFWTFDYAREYVSALPLHVGLTILKTRITHILASAILIWILAGIGMFGLLANRINRRRAVFVLGFLLFSFLATCPGFYFRPHYFILVLPAVALLAGIGAHTVYDFLARDRSVLAAKAKPIVLVVIVLLHPAYHQRNFFFVMGPTMVSRMTYGTNPFPESLEIARFIKQHSTKDDRLAVIGSEPQIYFYSNRRSATGYIYTYALMESHDYALKMQKEMIEEIETARPKFLVFVSVPTSWLLRPRSERLIFRWFDDYQQKYYRKVGVVDILSRSPTIYLWDRSAVGYKPRSRFWLLVFQRKSYGYSNEQGRLKPG